MYDVHACDIHILYQYKNMYNNRTSTRAIDHIQIMYMIWYATYYYYLPLYHRIYRLYQFLNLLGPSFLSRV